MTPRALADQALARAEEAGFALAGIAEAAPPLTWEAYREWIAAGRHAGMGYLAASLDLRRSLDSLLPGVRSVLAVGLNTARPNPRLPGRPLIARYAHGRDYHKVMRRRLSGLAKALALLAPGSAWRASVDSAPMLEREWAMRAGLGWFGKNTCLINSHRGSWHLLGFLLSTAEMAPSLPARGGCGTCRLCIESCPTGAIVHEDGRWQVDARRCISYWTIENKGPIPDEIADLMGPWTFGCDVCQEACPFNQPRESQPLRAVPTQDPDMLAVRAWPSLEELAQIEEDPWDRLTQGSPVRRAGWQGLRRSALISLRNQGQ